MVRATTGHHGRRCHAGMTLHARSQQDVQLRVASVAFLACARAGLLGASCGPRFIPPALPLHASDHNGVALTDACFQGPGPHHVFVIGDWGGIGNFPVPADDRRGKREFVLGVDDRAQERVAAQMRRRANTTNPDYVLNVGDNFYWGGIDANCGAEASQHVHTGQWGPVFERMYHGPGLDGKQWLGVLGNHDYGGYIFTSGWDQLIGYTWVVGGESSGRWMTPAQYWRVKARYDDFSVDYFFVDTNTNDARPAQHDPMHNMCGAHNAPGATCGATGPTSIEACPKWFEDLWEKQQLWLREGLRTSEADWQVIVTHFPPSWNADIWRDVTASYGVDLIVTGHVHNQQVHYAGPDNFLAPTAWIISGGGGGITSEGTPSSHGHDDEYGFMDLTLTKNEITIEAISHGGEVRSVTRVWGRRRPATASTTAQAAGAGGPPGGPSWGVAELPWWEPVDGGQDRLCRGTILSPSALGADYQTLAAADLMQCKDLCERFQNCEGLDFNLGGGRCRLWVHPIATSEPNPGSTCLRFVGDRSRATAMATLAVSRVAMAVACVLRVALP